MKKNDNANANVIVNRDAVLTVQVNMSFLTE